MKNLYETKKISIDNILQLIESKIILKFLFMF